MLLCALGLPLGRAPAAAPLVALGAGHYATAPRPGTDDALTLPPDPRYRAGAELKLAAPAGQWYSSVLYQRWSRPLYALPLSFRAAPEGIEIGWPHGELVVGQPGGRRAMHWLHAAELTVAPLGFRPEDARLEQHGDWLARVRLGARSGPALHATVLHGSPYAYFDCDAGDVALRIRGAASPLAPLPGDPREAPVASFTTAGHAYALFAPTGARLEWSAPTQLVLHLPSRARYFSVAALPDATAATLAEFRRLAYAFPTDTRATWAYDETRGIVRTSFRVTTVARQGANRDTLLGLYPHHWAALETPLSERHRYATVRGPIRLIAGQAFATELRYHGFVPFWPGLTDAGHRARLAAALAAETRAPPVEGSGGGPYWLGKELNALAQLARIADVEGDGARRDAWFGELRERMEAAFDGRHAVYFVADRRNGAWLGYPQEYQSIQDLNDHHFHYGYWLNAAGELALHEPGWLAPGRYGGMIGRLVADIATAERGRADFPYLRYFDPYEGHSWASGIVDLDAGNDQESSSEAVNAWAGLVLLGEASGNRALRDLGVYLYASEIASVEAYWFDRHHEVLAPEYAVPFATIVWGGKYDHASWWTEEPRQVALINTIPFTPASTYLGADPALVRAIVARLPAEEAAYRARAETDGTQPDVWQDLLAAYLALADPAEAGRRWDPAGAIEFGETRSHTLFWLSSLAELGTPDFSVSADTTLYAVFRAPDGRRTYLAYNAGAAPRRVRFSTGVELEVGAHALARSP